MASAVEVAAMARAVTLSAAGLGRTAPNPVVGAVVLDAGGRQVGEGFHARAGGPHAEVVALSGARERARAGTVVVTLEPCRHAGRTGPCTAALLRAGVARVVYAVPDPTPRAAGGAAELAAAGVAVEGGVLADAAARVNEAWLLAARLGRPFVTWKCAATLDGRVAAADGTSRWITGPAARADAHRLRAECDAILVGTGTALADDPRLTVRVPGAPPAHRQPLRVVLGRRPLPPGARLLDGSAETLLIADRDPAGALKLLYDRGVRHVLVEGGPTVAGAFVAAGLVDRVVGYLAPALLGAGPPALGDAGLPTLAAARRLRFDDVVRVGPDLRWTARPAGGEG